MFLFFLFLLLVHFAVVIFFIFAVCSSVSVSSIRFVVASVSLVSLPLSVLLSSLWLSPRFVYVCVCMDVAHSSSLPRPHRRTYKHTHIQADCRCCCRTVAAFFCTFCLFSLLACILCISSRVRFRRFCAAFGSATLLSNLSASLRPNNKNSKSNRNNSKQSPSPSSSSLASSSLPRRRHRFLYFPQSLCLFIFNSHILQTLLSVIRR